MKNNLNLICHDFTAFAGILLNVVTSAETDPILDSALCCDQSEERQESCRGCHCGLGDRDALTAVCDSLKSALCFSQLYVSLTA